MNIRRSPRATIPSKEGPRANADIRVAQVQLINAEGQNIGIISKQEAQNMADEANLDLVEIVPNATPPVCKIIDLGKLKYQNQKKAAEARKKQKTVDLKEIKMRPNIDTNDYNVKMKAINRFLADGDKVKVTLRFRGREFAHQELGMKLLVKVKDETAVVAKTELEPSMEGRQMIMILAPR